MPTLNWIGKDKIINHHHHVPFHVLEHKYGFRSHDLNDKSETNSGNMIIHGDNLIALKSLLPKYEGKIDCIYIDPPYNTGEKWIYNDNVDDPEIKKWLKKEVGAEGEDLCRHDKWLCMMYPRLVLLYKLLKNDGLIFISINDIELNRLYLICDEIFTIKNNVGTFVWKSRSKPSNTGDAKFKPQKDAEYILCYKKQEDPKYNYISGSGRSYPHEDHEGSYRIQTILKSNRGESFRSTMNFEVNGYRPPQDQRWQAGYDTIKDLFDRNRITFETGNPMRKIYTYEENDKVSPFYCFIEKNVSGSAENGKDTLNKIVGNKHGFDTVKPVQLIKYLLRHSMPDNAIILDCFGGSGTTPHAVLELNKEDGGNRRFIIAEIREYAENIIAERIKKVMTGYPFKGRMEYEIYTKKLTISNLNDCEKYIKEANDVINTSKDEYDIISKPSIKDNCIKVIATKEYNGFMEGLGGEFDFYELGAPMFKDDGYLNEEEVGEDKIREFIYYTETHQPLIRKREDMSQYLLDTYKHTGYYFYYHPKKKTELSLKTLKIVTERAEQYIIYADVCHLSKKFMTENHIIFKKIPRDIKKF